MSTRMRSNYVLLAMVVVVAAVVNLMVEIHSSPLPCVVAFDLAAPPWKSHKSIGRCLQRLAAEHHWI